jgi:hypothetical protein
VVGSWWRQLVRPEAPEPLPLLHLRRGARFILATNCLLLVLNLLYWWMHRHDAPDSRQGVVIAALLVNVGSHAGSALTNAWLLLRPRSERAFRAGVMVSLSFIVVAGGVGTWVAGVSLAVPPFLLIIAVSRIYYDGRIGLVAYLESVLVHFVLLALVLSGLLPQRMQSPPDEVVHIGTAIHDTCRLVAYFTLAWLSTSLMANRYRRAEQTLRVALDARDRLRRREQAAATGAVAVTQTADEELGGEPTIGRMSGRLLAGLYDVHELLGRGGMGEVYQGLRLTDGREVAIKILHPALGSDERMLERFRREAALAARLPARFVPALFDQGTSPDGLHFMILERLHGEDLGRKLQQAGRLPPAEVAGIVDELAAALDAAHALGIAHRDLKPSNVFLLAAATPPRVRLLDFGIARLFEAATTHGLTGHAVLGTPGFLAPEQARGDGARIGPATDVFALGALTYRALTGEHAFPGRDLLAAVHEALYHDPPPPSRGVPGLHADVDLVIATALAKVPEDRQASASDFARDLQAAIAGRLAAPAREHAERVIAHRVRPTVVETVTSVRANGS